MTLLADDARLWDVVFREQPSRIRFVRRLVDRAGANVLDVGCATGSLCRRLRKNGANTVGLDINEGFIAAARSVDPHGEYHVGGTTLSYALTNRSVAKTLANFRRHLKSSGYVAIDVLNAIAFAGPRPFQVRTEHQFDWSGFRATAALDHRLQFQAQTMTEQVSWRIEGRAPCRDAEETLRLFFPQELVFQLETAGFRDVTLSDGYGRRSKEFGGRRLIAVAKAKR